MEFDQLKTWLFGVVSKSLALSLSLFLPRIPSYFLPNSSSYLASDLTFFTRKRQLYADIYFALKHCFA